MIASRWLGASAMALMASLIMAPTPGATGSCASQVEYADAQSFCRERLSWSCAREHQRGLLGYRPPQSDAELAACRAAVDSMCAGATFGSGCKPTVRATQACIGALREVSRLSTPELDLVECRRETYCGEDFVGGSLRNETDGGAQ